MRFLFVAFLAASLLLTAACAKKQTSKAEEPEIQPTSESEQTIKSFSLVGYSEAGKKKWEIEGAVAQIFADVVNLSSIAAKAYGEETQVTLTADEGTFDKTNNNVQLNKNVTAVTDEGTKLTTDSLTWDAKTDSIVTDKRVLVEKENLTVEGNGAVAQPGLKQVKLNNDVTVKVKPQTVITCDGPLEVDYKNNIAYFNNNVLVEDDRGKISSDKMEVFFQPKTKTIDKVIATGNVKIVRGENTTYSEQATYTAADGKVVLTGQPKLVIYNQEQFLKQK